MAHEVDFVAVGDKSKGGDAIAFRYGNLRGSRDEQTVVVIDGGTLESGSKLVGLIKGWYRTETVDLVLSTHPDADHAVGLRNVLQELDVRMLCMHRPWAHAPAIAHLFEASPLQLQRHIARALDDAHELEKIAAKKGIKIVEPFQGSSTQDGSLLILGPSLDYYRKLVCDFRQTPEPAQGGIGAALKSVGGGMLELATRVAESLQIETLTDSGTTSAENNSSAILLLRTDDRKLLFTGDAGIDALTRAADYALTQGIALDDLSFVQVPHHGSRRNVGPTILNRVKGQTAYISAPVEGAPKHPSARVVNAFIRRGAKVFATQGIDLHHRHGVDGRPGYVAVTPIPLATEVGDDED